MIVIAPGRIVGNLGHDIEMLNRLSADMKLLASGRFPAARDLAVAPVLTEYVLAKKELPCLAGLVTGHPRLGDGHLVATSDLWLYAPTMGWARTLSRTYRLGRPHHDGEDGDNPSDGMVPFTTNN